MKYQSSNFLCSKVICKIEVSTDLQNEGVTDGQNDRQDKNNMPPDLRSSWHKNQIINFLHFYDFEVLSLFKRRNSCLIRKAKLIVFKQIHFRDEAQKRNDKRKEFLCPSEIKFEKDLSVYTQTLKIIAFKRKDAIILINNTFSFKFASAIFRMNDTPLFTYMH